MRQFLPGPSGSRHERSRRYVRQHARGSLEVKDCADCGGFDVEWMYSCQKHKGVEYCRGCSCPFCDEDALDEEDYEIDEHGVIHDSTVPKQGNAT